jgi:hypothetical protein
VNLSRPSKISCTFRNGPGPDAARHFLDPGRIARSTDDSRNFSKNSLQIISLLLDEP